MNALNTIEHRRSFEEMIAAADARREGDEVTHAILYAALAVSLERLGAATTIRDVTHYLQGGAARF